LYRPFGRFDIQLAFKTYPLPTESNYYTNTSGDTNSRFARQFAQSDANQPLDAVGPPHSTDAELTRVFDAWPILPTPIRRAILALVESVAGGGG
jgi:hypothetical protein